MTYINRIILSGLKWSLILITGMVTLTVTWGVASRFLLKISSVWTGELSSYGLVWITFLGAAYAIFQNKHIRFDSLINKFPKSIKVIIELIMNTAILCFVLIIMYYGGKLAVASIGDQTGTLPFTLGVVYLVLPISGAIMVLGVIVEMAKLIKWSRSKAVFENNKSLAGEKV